VVNLFSVSQQLWH